MVESSRRRLYAAFRRGERRAVAIAGWCRITRSPLQINSLKHHVGRHDRGDRQRRPEGNQGNQHRRDEKRCSHHVVDPGLGGVRQKSHRRR